MKEVQIRIGTYTYFREVPDPRNPGGTRRKVALARQGDKIEVDEADYQRGQSLNAFGDPEAERRAQEESGELDVSTAGVDELVEYLRENEPNVQETIDLAGDDPDAAARLIEAEEQLADENDDDPRKGVIDGLSKIADTE